ncbi:MAG: hypothetical protein RL632_1137 [Bacteroidota bacterium]|jgi:hypothetical protein
MKLNPKFIQAIADAAIPLLGYFLWEWNLYFILLFYILDLLASEIIAHLSTKKIREYLGQQGTDIKRPIFSFFLLCVLCLMLHIFTGLALPGIDFKKEALAFWFYEDMGIPQGYVFVPLIVFVAIQRYRMEFLIRGKFRTTTLSAFWTQHFRVYFMLIGGVGMLLGIAQLIVLPELVYVLTAVGATTTYTLYFKPD